MADQALLSVRDFAVQADGRELLTGLDLTLAPGEIVALRGPSGSGKTTLLRSLAWLQNPSGGTARMRDLTAEEIGWTDWRRQVCLVPQLPAVFPGTVSANLSRPFAFRATTAAFCAERARNLLDDLLLTDVDLDANCSRLSVGQQQRIGVVRALLLEPTVMLLDEPTSALDPIAAAAMEDVLRADVDRRSAAALVVSHDPTRSDRWCDRSVDLTPLLAGAAR